MWIVVKYKTNEFNILKNSFIKILCDSPEFYKPKIKYEKFINNKLKVFEKNILENYLICRHDKFKDHKIINLLRNLRGLTHLLDGYKYNQKELANFVKFCKSHEDQQGFLSQSFFKLMKKTKAKFISGPFTNMFFEILDKNSNKLKILIGNIVTTLPNKAKYMYLPI